MKRRSTSRPFAVAFAGTALIVLLFGLSGCDEKPPELLFDGNYAGWATTTDKLLNYQIPGHGEQLRKIYINETGTKVTSTVDDEGRVFWDYPDGTVIVKEIYNDTVGTTLANWTIMIKARNDERARAGWIWLNKEVATGNEAVFSDSSFCVTCHAGANRPHPYDNGNPDDEFRDYVFFPYRTSSP